MLKKLVLIITTAILFISCSSDYDKKLKISATTWVGYTPLFYAKEMGWLDPLNIKLLNVSSLSENMYLYKAGNSDAYVGTQYEYNILSKEDSSLVPVMLFDRSYGGDVVMSNLSLDELKGGSGVIDAYLEMDSINFTLLEDFIKKNGFEGREINYINQDQAHISTLKSDSMERPTLIVTYSPYNSELQKKGFMEIASTKDGFDLLIVDAMFTTTEVLQRHKKQFRELKKAVDMAVVELQKNPKQYYEKIKPYMLNINYDEFMNSLDNIIWINNGISSELKERIKDNNFPVEDLI
jgi:NitT/TauT family transport system substrate-binding protein